MTSIPKYINFTDNINHRIHHWYPYIHGFSAAFVNQVINEQKIGKKDIILDPFAGAGTVNACAKLLGVDSIGIEINPLMHFVTRTKLHWDIDSEKVIRQLNKIDFSISPTITAPDFLLSEKQFRKDVLKNLLVLKENISHINDDNTQALFKLVLSGILIKCSNLTRAPSLGYSKNKKVNARMPFDLFTNKVQEIAEDLRYLNELKQSQVFGHAQVFQADAKAYEYPDNSIGLAITSPPYINGIDYVMNYKIELAWLDFVHSQNELRTIKERMIVCDNISRGAIKIFAEKESYSNRKINSIFSDLKNTMEQITYRRNDMHFVVKKYFDDMYKVMLNVYKGLAKNKRFVIVVGDSVIAGVHIPTDILLAEIGREVGFQLDALVVARARRSGKQREIKLRESIITLFKS